MQTKIYNTYLFDFDGTLVDSMPTFADVMIRILGEEGLTQPDGFVKIITPLGYGGTADYLISLGSASSREDLLARMQAYAYEEYAHRIPLKKGVREALEQLKARGASLNILTASPHSVLDVTLARLGICDMFEHVWSSDDFNTTKANPEIYKMAAERLGVLPSEYVFVDDNLGALRTARAAGVAAYGIYDDSSADYIDEIRESADAYLYLLTDLL